VNFNVNDQLLVTYAAFSDTPTEEKNVSTMGRYIGYLQISGRSVVNLRGKYYTSL
jgi:hypothetical protein